MATAGAVRHELKVYDELPPRRTLLNDQLAEIVNHKEWYGKAVQIGSYAKAAAANGAKHLLQKRWGKTSEANGWTFSVRGITENGESRSGLFAIYSPNEMKHGEKSAARRDESVPHVVDAESEAHEEAKVEGQDEGQEPEPKGKKELTPQQMARLSRIENLDELLAGLEE